MNGTRWSRAIGLSLLAALAACSRDSSPSPGVDVQIPTNRAPVHTSRLTASSFERVRLSATNGMGSLIGFRRVTPPPWNDGNLMSLEVLREGTSAPPPSLDSFVPVMNIHSENFGEITRRLGITEVEALLYTETVPAENGIEEYQRRYALVTDSRIPQSWLLSPPKRGEAPFPSRGPIFKEFYKTFPQYFRARDEEKRASQVVEKPS